MQNYDMGLIVARPDHPTLRKSMELNRDALSTSEYEEDMSESRGFNRRGGSEPRANLYRFISDAVTAFRRN
jgi:hypothetical protein